MTVGMLIDRLDRFRLGILRYREMCKQDIPHQYSKDDFSELLEVEALRDTLRQEFSLLDKYVTALSQGRYRIHLDSRGLQDIYVQAFSDAGRDWHFDVILRDLEHMLAELQERPLHQPMTVHHQQWKNSQDAQFQRSFGSLGHLGHSSASAKPASLLAVLKMVAHILHQRIDRPEDEEKLQNHLQAIVDHSEMADFLPLPPSSLF